MVIGLNQLKTKKTTFLIKKSVKLPFYALFALQSIIEVTISTLEQRKRS
jgi:hypothetical protein